MWKESNKRSSPSETERMMKAQEVILKAPAGKPSPKRVPIATVEKVLHLYSEQYFDFNVRHSHEQPQEEHNVELSYTWVRAALRTAGLVKECKSSGTHRKRRALRLPQELTVRGITDVVAADQFLRDGYTAEFKQGFTLPAAQNGSAFVRLRRKDLDWALVSNT